MNTKTSKRKKGKSDRCIDSSGRIVIRRDLVVDLGIPPDTKIKQTLCNGGIFLEIAEDVCRICYREGEEMFKHFKICVHCAREIITAR